MIIRTLPSFVIVVLFTLRRCGFNQLLLNSHLAVQRNLRCKVVYIKNPLHFERHLGSPFLSGFCQEAKKRDKSGPDLVFYLLLELFIKQFYI